MKEFEIKALDYYGEVTIEKSLIHEAGFGARAIPTYVGEWILSHFVEDGELSEERRASIARFLSQYLPMKGQKNEVKNRLLNMEPVSLLDDYSVSVNLETGIRQLRIPLLDIDDAHVSSSIVEQNDLMVTSGVWGIGELFYIPPDDAGGKGQVWMREFRPFQIGRIDLTWYIDCRKHFALLEWMELLVSSMGFNPIIHTMRQKLLLLTRLLPIVEPRTNLVELAPKGTGKSFVYDNLSRHARVIGGGKVSPAVLFYNLRTHVPGLIARYDVVVLDEVQSIKGDSAGELLAGLKVYLESGRFSRGNTMGTSEAGFVMLGNITLGRDLDPVRLEDGLFREIPNFLRETAFIDRIHGLLPGWELPRVTKDTPSRVLGFKGDFFSEVLHRLRHRVEYTDYVKEHMRLKGCDDLRDLKAITRLAAGYMKLLFPDMKPNRQEFIEYCILPAVELRQRVRDELHKMDAEYKAVEIEVLDSNGNRCVCQPKS